MSSNYRSLSDIGLSVGDTVTLSGEYNVGSGKYSPRINFSPVPYDTDDEREKARRGPTFTGRGRFEFTTTVPEGTTYLRVMLHNGSGYVKSEQPETILLRRLKLEKGPNATAWVPGSGD